jgi:hypothetical protein
VVDRVPLADPGRPFGLELGGVLAGEDDVLGAEAVLQAVELGDGLAGVRGRAAGFGAVLSAGFALLVERIGDVP